VSWAVFKREKTVYGV